MSQNSESGKATLGEESYNHLGAVIENMIASGSVKPEQVRSFTFVELYHADPAQLTPEERRDQVEYRNSAQWAELRRKHGLE